MKRLRKLAVLPDCDMVQLLLLLESVLSVRAELESQGNFMGRQVGIQEVRPAPRKQTTEFITVPALRTVPSEIWAAERLISENLCYRPYIKQGDINHVSPLKALVICIHINIITLYIDLFEQGN